MDFSHRGFISLQASECWPPVPHPTELILIPLFACSPSLDMHGVLHTMSYSIKFVYYTLTQFKSSSNQAQGNFNGE